MPWLPLKLAASSCPAIAPECVTRVDLLRPLTVRADNRFRAPRLRAKTALSAILAIVGLASCGPSSAAPLKPLITGLISMGSIVFHKTDDGVPVNSLDSMATIPGVMSGVVINISWAQLQPTPDALDTSAIDSALADVRAYNAKFPATPLAISLRIWPGPNAPAWIKSLGGPPVEIHRIYRGQQPQQVVTIGRFWSEPYAAKWIALQTALGTKYDAEPLIREVSDTSCASYTDELFVIAADPESLANMQQAGFSDAAFRHCLERSPTDYDAWKTTRLQVAVNPFRDTDSGRPALDNDATKDILEGMRHRYGQRIILANHSLKSPPFEWITPVYDELRSLGPPIEFQTASPKGINGLDWDATMGLAAQFGGGAVELWSGQQVDGFETHPQADLKRWSGMIAKSPGGS